MSELERARDALFALDSGMPREQWFRVAAAAKAAGLDFLDFYDWSKEAANYRGESDCHSLWKSISSGGGITERTLFAMAREAGWQEPQKRVGEAHGGRAVVVPSRAGKSPKEQRAPSASDGAAEIWEHCVPATAENLYIVRKGGLTVGLREYPLDADPLTINGVDVRGWLAIPCCELDGSLKTIQFIPSEGDKLNLPGAIFGDSFFTVGDLSKSSQIYIVEGLGQAWAVHAVTDAPAVVCFGSGRMKRVAAVLHRQLPKSSVVLVSDRGKEIQCADIADSLGCSWVEMPQDQPLNFDANDLALMDGGVEILAALLACPKFPTPRFRLLSGSHLGNASRLRWLVHGVLPSEGVAALYGQSGSGKSFLTLDLAAAIAGNAGRWFGYRLTPAPVTYCVLEGEAGFGKRIASWSKHYKKSCPDNLRFVTESFNLLNPTDVEELSRNIRAAGGAGGMVVIDTLSRSTPGADENSSISMGNLIASSSRLQSGVGGLVLLVHHAGKEGSKGLRGHSSLEAAVDAIIQVRKKNNRYEWQISKSKDDKTGATHAFTLETVSLGAIDEEEEITSCVVIPDCSRKLIKEVVIPRGKNQSLAREALDEEFLNSGRAGDLDIIPKRHCLELEDAVRIVANRLPVESRRRNERAREALDGLIGQGIYSLQDGRLSRIT